MNINGTIIKMGDTVQVSESFKKRELVINTGGEYPQYIPIEFLQEKVSILDNFISGQVVSVNFDLRGREWNGRYLVNVVGYNIQELGANG